MRGAVHAHASNPQVDEVRAVRGHHHVSGRDVPVYHARRMQRRKRLAQLPRQGHRARRRQRPPLPHKLAQSGPLHIVVHRHERIWQPVQLAYVRQPRNAGRLGRRRHRGFTRSRTRTCELRHLQRAPRRLVRKRRRHALSNQQHGLAGSRLAAHHKLRRAAVALGERAHGHERVVQIHRGQQGLVVQTRRLRIGRRHQSTAPAPSAPMVFSPRRNSSSSHSKRL